MRWILIACLALSGCSQRPGHADGAPFAFLVTLERPFVHAIAQRQIHVHTDERDEPFRDSRETATVGLSTTEVTLRGGSRPRGEDLFRQRLSWGENRFTVPLRTGGRLWLSVAVDGGWVGWLDLGPIELDRSPIVLPLTRENAHLHQRRQADERPVPAAQ